MAIEVLLPKLGLTMQEGTIEEWLAAPGAPVRPGDPLLRMTTDKVDIDVEAEGEGVFHPAVEVGATLVPGTVIGWLLAGGEPIPAPPAPASALPPPAQDPQEPQASVTAPEGRLFASPNARRVAAAHGVDLAALRGTGPGGRVVSEDVEDYLAAQADAHVPQADGATGIVPSGPLVRRDARERGVDLAAVNGTGVGGRVRRADIEAAVAATAVVEAAVAEGATGPTVAGTRVIPFKGMRGAIARRMHASLQEMAQLTHGYEVRMDGVADLRARLKEEWAGTGQAVPTLNDFVVRAASLALQEHPLLNATVRDDGVHLLEEIHVGLAVAVPDGLVVPVIRDAAGRSLAGLAGITRELAGAARAGTLGLDQLEGATFVVTSLGAYGVDMFTPVIYPGNVAILGVGRLRDGVAWEGDRPLRTRVLTLSLTFDHRAVDGAPAAEYLRTVDRLLRRPLRLLAG
ncbi:2-oxo acid dehydrogenase subunit E2 [Actinomadura rudentiformis]|uniref:Dihydrolipoamide acetyltransferase component of pyruvate dehydrogenase complex n=1 Tax=Actinomadura rudentiformis TaxID=359158 RepID=A0A6H9YNE7_9ACTN|nr:2-oxo acid dehydrogenase subunit E2 [Actinomadura rudentiformis]KAB2340386.1 2-oxo acid dehydrogenase subunit E2 [Actinomadura rudentiformis]